MSIPGLVKQITYHNMKYWEDNDPEISDVEYDRLMEELRKLAPDHELLNRFEGGQGKIKHLRPMLSLGKCYDSAGLMQWASGVARGPDELFQITGKWDGCSLEIQPDGVCVTRGDGEWGEDASHVAGAYKGDTPRYGEAVVLKSTFASQPLSSRGGTRYKTTRSAAAGILADVKSDTTLLTFVPFDQGSELISFIGLSAVDWEAKMSGYQQGDIPTDGLVVALVDQAYALTLGQTEHHPRHSIALKYTNPTGITKLIAVEWQCGKFGLTPVGILEPVVISGCTHDRVSLHNMAQIGALDLWIGDQVEIERCADVIPQIKCVKLKAKSPGVISPPSLCPACASGVRWAISEGVPRCTNPHCGGTTAKKLLDSLNRVGVENIGPSVASALVAAGFTTLPQVFEMSVQDWLGIEGFAAKSANAMQRQFTLINSLFDYQLLGAMNIEGIGISLAKQICAKVNPATATVEELMALAGIGPLRAQGIIDGWDSGLWSWALGELEVQFTKGLADRPTVCFTGADEMARDAWVKLAEKAGYAYSKTVNKKLTVLVASRTDSTKAKKAAEYGIRVINYSQFREEVNSAVD